MNDSSMQNDSIVKRQTTVQNKIQSFAFVIAVVACVFISVYFSAGGFFNSGKCCKKVSGELINPNLAPAVSLTRLPGIGIVRAEAIVSYRENFYKNNRPAFRNCSDLQKIKGIGPVTAEKISKWLDFSCREPDLAVSEK